MESREYKKMKVLYDKMKDKSSMSDETSKYFELAFQTFEEGKKQEQKESDDVDKTIDGEDEVADNYEEKETETLEEEKETDDDVETKEDEKVGDEKTEPDKKIEDNSKEVSQSKLIEDYEKKFKEMKEKIDELFNTIKKQDVGIPAQGGKFVSNNGAVSEFK